MTDPEKTEDVEEAFDRLTTAAFSAVREFPNSYSEMLLDEAADVVGAAIRDGDVLTEKERGWAVETLSLAVGQMGMGDRSVPPEDARESWQMIRDHYGIEEV